jgi:hypothetical protein
MNVSATAERKHIILRNISLAQESSLADVCVEKFSPRVNQADLLDVRLKLSGSKSRDYTKSVEHSNLLDNLKGIKII